MRRSDKEVTELPEILTIMKKCAVCRVAFIDGDFPYIVPLNFGVEELDGKISLFFHSALQGKKLDLLNANNKVAFEMDCATKIYIGEIACDSNMAYKSVCGRGTITVLKKEEKSSALTKIMEQYQAGKAAVFDAERLEKTVVLKLAVSEVTAKSSYKTH